MKSFDDFLKECVKAQEEYCEKKNKPMFIPLDGCCDYCHRPLFDDAFGGIYGGLSLEQAGNQLITVCPYCRKSFCG